MVLINTLARSLAKAVERHLLVAYLVTNNCGCVVMLMYSTASHAFDNTGHNVTFDTLVTFSPSCFLPLPSQGSILVFPVSSSHGSGRI